MLPGCHGPSPRCPDFRAQTTAGVKRKESWKEGGQARCESGAHLIHSLLREAELGQAGGVAVGHVRPAAEEDEGAGGLGERAQEHLDTVFLLGVGMSR